MTRRRTTHVKAAPPAPKVETPAADVVSEHEEISKLAYQYWEARGRTDGSHEEDWFRAEQEFRRRSAGA
ncbi:MAG: DUF2934 domain-containing protein [Acidobacteriota bacterium]